MRILLTGDWQVAPTNISLFKGFSAWLLQLAIKHRVGHLFHLGDVKHAFNPVDVRVVQCVVDCFRTFQQKGIPVTILEGNHDLLAVRGNESWLPLLGEVGCTVVMKPDEHHWKDGTSIFYLPYSENKDASRAVLKKFGRSAGKLKASGTVLLFHDEISGCRLNVQTRYDGKGLHLKDFHRESYKALFGGHIHFRQQMGNLAYVGSPVAHDWGEANQRKYVVIYDTETGETKWINTRLPGYFDPALPNFEKSRPSDFHGHSVRMRVVVPQNESVQTALDKARRKGMALYPGAHIFAESLKVREAARVESAAAGLIEKWVDANIPAILKESAPAATAYLEARLGKLGFIQRQKISPGIIKGRNFLSFDRFEFDFALPGITVLEGKNGGGKSNVLSAIGVLLHGKTLKGQQRDAWKKRKSHGGAKLSGSFTVGSHKLKVARGRVPVSLKFSVDGKDQSIGTEPKTQIALADYLNQSWETLTSSLMIDQHTTNMFVNGTDSVRKAILGKFLGLDQFGEAEKYIKAEKKSFRNKLDAAHVELSVASAALERTKKDLLEIPAGSVAKYRKELKAALVQDRACRKQYQALDLLEPVLLRKYYEYKHDWEHLVDKRSTAAAECAQNKKVVAQFRKLGETCGRCSQPISDKLRARLVSTTRAVLRESVDALRKAERNVKLATNMVHNAESAHRKVKQQLSENNSQAISTEYEVSDARVHLREAKTADKKRKRLLRDKSSQQHQVQDASGAIEYYESEFKFLDFCLKAVGRDGVRVHLMERICPALDEAVEMYAEIFSQDGPRPRFVIDGEDLTLAIDNPDGGETLTDQSRGERSLISLITALALRDVFSPFDLLIFDEPGDGLDEKNARQFAIGLTKLSSRFRSVFLTSHNKSLLEELSPDRIVTVTKQHGTSNLNYR